MISSFTGSESKCSSVLSSSSRFLLFLASLTISLIIISMHKMEALILVYFIISFIGACLYSFRYKKLNIKEDGILSIFIVTAFMTLLYVVLICGLHILVFDMILPRFN